MRVLITGAGGQVGHELVSVFGAGGHEVAGFDHANLDITNRDAVRAAVVEFQPEAIVHSAAWTAVDACESDPDRAFAVNAMGTRFIVEASRLVDAAVHYISTDYVFDGTKESPYVEWDQTNPQSVYGASKLAGERELGDNSSIIRTSWVCGFHGPNMVKTILRLAGEHDTLSFVDDQLGCPTFADDLAAMIAQLVVERRTGVGTNSHAKCFLRATKILIVCFRYQQRTCNHLDPRRGQLTPSLTTLRSDYRVSTPWPISANRCGGLSPRFVERTTKVRCCDELATGKPHA